jgi:SAM-dependent methyltransferase
MTDKREHMENKYFDVLDDADDNLNYFSPIIKALVETISLDKNRVLDVGCGTGKFMSQLFNYCEPTLIGVDGVTSVADRALARGYESVKVVDDLSVDPLPFDDGYFDCVICKDVMEHLYDPKFALAEINRVLRQDGVFLFHVPNHFPLVGRVRFLMNNNLDTFQYFSDDESRWTFPHIRFFEYSDIVSVLEANGFDVVKDLSYNFLAVPVFGRFLFLNRLFRWLIRNFPNDFVSGFTIIAKKNHSQCL